MNNAVTPEDRTMAVLSHAAALIAMIVSAGWLSFVGPLIIWFLYKDKSPFVRTSAASSFNFNVLCAIVNIVGWILCITVIGIVPGLILIAASYVAQLVFHILGALAANKGETYKYPFNLPILT